jgi:hypothetical protein
LTSITPAELRAKKAIAYAQAMGKATKMIGPQTRWFIHFAFAADD